MTQIPDIQIPGYITQTALAAVQGAIDEAARLGLTWRLRPGTVAGTTVVNPVKVSVVVDGDDATVKARSMVGALAPNQRVWCAQIPPAGIYVIGVIGPQMLAPTVRTFTASGTWTKPAGLAWARITVTGGGGGGGGAAATAAGQSSMGAGGGGGATGVVILSAAALPPTVTVTRGAGGPGVSGANGTAGSTSSFGSLVTAEGGGAGAFRAASATPHGVEAGNGGTVVTGTGVTSYGGSAGGTGWGSDNGLGISGHGGSSHLGGGARGRRTSSAGQTLIGFVGRVYGGGGSGALNSGGVAAATGGGGANGVVIIEEHYH